MPTKLKRVGFLVPTLNDRKVKTLNRDAVPRLSGTPLQRRNQRLMRERPWCVKCAEEGVQTLVAEWDHEIPLSEGGPDTDENLQGLCLPHPREKSPRDHARRHGT